MNKFYLFFIVIFLTVFNSYIFAQQDSITSPLFRITLTDGSEVIGTILSESASEIKFITVSKIEMTISKHQIKSMEKSSGQIVDGVLRRSDPNKTRLFFAPTARPLKAGSGYFSDYELFFQ